MALYDFQTHPCPPRRVVVTGLGMVTALGCGRAANARGFRAGTTAFRPVTAFDVARQRTRVAAEAEVPAVAPDARVAGRTWRRMDRAARLLYLAAAEAWAQAGWAPGGRTPWVLGTTSGGMTLGEAFYRQAIGPGPTRRGQATRVLQYQAQRQVLDVAGAMGAPGPVQIIANACASGSNAIGEAGERIRRGETDRVLTGGYDGLSQLVFAGFDSLQALSPTTCRPFDAGRDGLALGEGAAVLALEEREAALARGAGILGELVGYGAATDVHHLTQPQPAGEAAWRSMVAATRQAGLGVEQIAYVNAHGTGTLLNDGAEAQAINRWAGAHAAALRVSSTKAAIGHLLGAAGAVEAGICLLALQEQWLPPMPGVQTPDPACQFSLVLRPQDAVFDHALSNSFGFGGANATLVFRRWS